MDSYGTYALKHPHEVQFVAVAESKHERREQFRSLHGLPAERCFADWRDLLEQPKLADAILICTQDKMHFAPAMQALQAGYHVLLEKPMSPDPQECIEMGTYAQEQHRLFVLCHVLRYTNFFATLKQ